MPGFAKPRRRRARRLCWLVVAGLATLALAPSAGPALAGDKTEITICHGTGSHGNPYVVNSPAINSSGAFAGELADGHNSHTGPLWFPGIDVEWGDIIPPYEYAPANFSFPGLNWTDAGQAIYDNGCSIPQATLEPTPTPVEPTATPMEPTPTPTGDVEPTATATATPTGGVEGATGTPAATLPPTDATGGPSSSGDGWRMILLAMAGLLVAALILTRSGARSSIRRRR